MINNSDTNPVLGFDLGTTFSALSRWIDGRGPKIIPNNKGEYATQSVVYYDPSKNEILVGSLAYRKGLIEPENVIVGVKRLMDNSEQKVTIGNKEFSPIEISSLILGKIYKDAMEKYPKGTFESRGSVVTVPFYFKAHQIANTQKAAEKANINTIGILQEPIAASLSYAFQLAEEHADEEFRQNILVFDLGGGTFDLTLFNLEHTKKTLKFEVLATGGDDRLGGMDFDKRLSKLILDKSKISLDGLEPKALNKAHGLLIEHSIETKKTLAASKDCYVAIPFIFSDKNLEVNITREEFEESIKDYLNKIGGIIDGVWAKSPIKPSNIDRIIPVGGSSVIPCVKNLVCDLIGEEKVWRDIDPSAAIAEGAAMYAAYLDDKEFYEKEIIITTRTCHALGIKTAGDHFVEIITANRKTPCEVKRLFSTSEDNVPLLDIEIYQGSGRIVKSNTHSLIGTISITDLPLKPAGDLDIEVSFKINEEQVLSIAVVVEGQRKSTTLNYT